MESSEPHSGTPVQRPAPELQIVDAETAQLLLTLPLSPALSRPLPRMGEHISLQKQDGSLKLLQVQEVLWHIDEGPDAPGIRGIAMKVSPVARDPV